MMNGNSNNANSSNIIYTPEWEWVLQNEYFWWFEKIVKSNSLKIFVVYSSEQSSRFSSSSSSLVECIAQYWSWLALCVANKWQSTIWILQKQSKREFSVFFHFLFVRYLFDDFFVSFLLIYIQQLSEKWLGIVTRKKKPAN